jgi:hypothetical protein
MAKPKAYAGDPPAEIQHTHFAKLIRGRILLPPFEELIQEMDTGRWISQAVMRSAREINRRPLCIEVDVGAWFGRDVLVVTFSGMPLEADTPAGDVQ